MLRGTVHARNGRGKDAREDEGERKGEMLGEGNKEAEETRRREKPIRDAEG